MSKATDEYRRELDELTFSSESKHRMANHIAEAGFIRTNSTAMPARRRTSHLAKHPARIALRAALVAAALIIAAGGTGAAMASGVLPLPADLLSDIFDGPACDTEVINRIGRPINTSCTNNGVTVTADAIIGDRNMYTIVYTLTFEDRSTLDRLPAPDANGHVGAFMDGTLYVDGERGAQGSSHIRDLDPTDNTLQYVEQMSVETSSLVGRTARAHLDSIKLMPTGTDEVVNLVTGPWDLKFKFNFEDTSIDIPVPENVDFDGATVKIEEATVSPVGISVRYNINRIAHLDGESGKMSDRAQASLDAISNLPLIVIFKDGRIENGTSRSGFFSVDRKDGTTDVHKTWPFTQICDTDEISSIQIGDTIIDMA